MSYMTTIKINGKDARTEWGLEVLDIKPFSPLSSVRHEYQGKMLLGSTVRPQKITLTGYIDQTNQDTTQQKIEALAGEIGQNGNGQFRKAYLEIIPLTAAGTAGNSAIYEVVSDGTFDLSHYAKGNRAKAGTLNVRLSFEVLATINPDGIVSRTTSVTATAANIYFEDTDCLQGADKVTAMWHNIQSGFGIQPNITALAVGDRFKHYSTNYSGTETGAHAWELGPYGNPALGFLLAGNNTLKFPTYYSLPILESYEFTAMIKFKWSGAADGTSKVLLIDDITPVNFQIYINTTSQNVYFQLNSSVLTVHSNVAFSSTDWNTIVVRHSRTSKDVWIHVPGQDTETSATASVSDYSDSPSYFYIGSATSGTTYRSDCYIGEVAIWKHPLSDDAAVAAAESKIAIRNNPIYELNKRLTFYLDFLNEFNALCNEHASISCGVTVEEGDLFVYQSDSKRVTHHSSTGISNEIANVGAPITDVPIWPVIERYNNIRLETLVSNVDFTVSYNPRRRR